MEGKEGGREGWLPDLFIALEWVLFRTSKSTDSDKT
jgi:hypothetical protein